MEDLEGKINKPTEEMSEEELQFHYFKVHDYNDDNKLDGIELISALTHHNGPYVFIGVKLQSEFWLLQGNHFSGISGNVREFG